MNKLVGCLLVGISVLLFALFFFPDLDEMCPFDFYFYCIPAVISLPFFFLDDGR